MEDAALRSPRPIRSCSSARRFFHPLDAPAVPQIPEDRQATGRSLSLNKEFKCIPALKYYDLCRIVLFGLPGQYYYTDQKENLFAFYVFGHKEWKVKERKWLEEAVVGRSSSKAIAAGVCSVVMAAEFREKIRSGSPQGVGFDKTSLRRWLEQDDFGSFFLRNLVSEHYVCRTGVSDQSSRNAVSEFLSHFLDWARAIASEVIEIRDVSNKFYTGGYSLGVFPRTLLEEKEIIQDLNGRLVQISLPFYMALRKLGRDNFVIGMNLSDSDLDRQGKLSAPESLKEKGLEILRGCKLSDISYAEEPSYPSTHYYIIVGPMACVNHACENHATATPALFLPDEAPLSSKKIFVKPYEQWRSAMVEFSKDGINESVEITFCYSSVEVGADNSTAPEVSSPLQKKRKISEKEQEKLKKREEKWKLSEEKSQNKSLLCPLCPSHGQ